MGAASILAMLSVFGNLAFGAVKDVETFEQSQENLQTQKVLEAYRYSARTPKQRKYVIDTVSGKVPKRAVFLLPALNSARSQWQVDMTVGMIEQEMFK